MSVSSGEKLRSTDEGANSEISEERAKAGCNGLPRGLSVISLSNPPASEVNPEDGEVLG